VAQTQAVYYRTGNGSQPVSDFIDTLDDQRQGVLDVQIDRLNGLGAFAEMLKSVPARPI
jgi:hypothetical protein